MRNAMAAEWTKLWSVRSTWWCLAGSALLMAAASGQLGIVYHGNNTNEITTDDTGITTAGAVAIESVALVQFVVIALAMLTVTSEYSTGGIRVTLQTVPRRAVVLAAKCAVVAPVMFVVGTVLGAIGGLVAIPALGDWGSSAGLVGDAFAVGLYLALVSVLTIGVAAALRSAVGTLTVVFLLLMMIPVLLSAAGSAVADALPSIAGTHFMNGDADPYGPVAGLLILAVWVVAAVSAGLGVLRARDA